MSRSPISPRAFPAWTEAQRRDVARACFARVARGILDHAVLWKADRARIQRYVRVEGEEHLEHVHDSPVIAIAPHFVGLDAGGVRLNTLVRGVSIYARQSNPAWDDWLLAIRSRFHAPLLLARGADLRTAVRAMKQGMPFYYLPDMDNGPDNSIFVPFFGVEAATLPMVPRLARLAGAKVIVVVTEMTDDGYVLHVEAPWDRFSERVRRRGHAAHERGDRALGAAVSRPVPVDAQALQDASAGRAVDLLAKGRAGTVRRPLSAPCHIIRHAIAFHQDAGRGQ